MPVEVNPDGGDDRKTDESMNKWDFIKTMYEQHWLSQREGVRERLQFIYTFIVIFASFIVILKENVINQMSLMIITLIMMLYSIVGLLFTLKVEGVLKARERAANRIVELYGLSDLNAKYDKSLWVTNVRIGRLFPIFFFMCFCFLLLIISNILFTEYIYIAALISVVIFILSANYLWKVKV